MKIETQRALTMPAPGGLVGGHRLFGALCLIGSLVFTAGCRQDMHDQAKYEPYEANPFYVNDMASRPLPPNTIARGMLRDDVEFYSGLSAAGQPVPAFPVETLRAHWPVAQGLDDEDFNRLVLRRGAKQFGVFCTPCHGATGAGNGVIVQRGFQQPTSFHEERLRNAHPGYFVNVMTEGFGQMSSYAAQIVPRDRWAVAAYIQALQLSQHARLAELPADVGSRFEEAMAAAASAANGHGGDGHAAEGDSAGHGPATHADDGSAGPGHESAEHASSADQHAGEQ